MRFLILIERSETGYSGYAPDVPGCVVSADSREEAEVMMRDALAFHIEGLREGGQPVPSAAVTYATFVEVAAPA